MKVVHIISGLGVGGAEKMLLKIVREHQKKNIATEIISLGTLGLVGSELRKQGIIVHTVGAEGRRIPSVGEILRFTHIVRRIAPNVIQGWMYHGNLAAFIAKCIIWPTPALVWNIRQTLGALEHEARLTRLVIKFSARVSRYADKIVYNAMDSKQQHIRVGYTPNNSNFIPNGFDLCDFGPRNAQREEERRKLGLKSDDILVGHVGRYHAKKDHHRFFEAISEVLKKKNNLYVVAFGREVSRTNQALAEQLNKDPNQDRIFLMGERIELRPSYQALDILVSSSSWGEGFSNVLGEGMASELVCVATNIGEAARLIGGAGKLVKPNDATAMAKAIIDVATMPAEVRRDIGVEARKRIEKDYSIEVVASQYLDLYLSLRPTSPAPETGFSA